MRLPNPHQHKQAVAFWQIALFFRMRVIELMA